MFQRENPGLASGVAIADTGCEILTGDEGTYLGVLHENAAYPGVNG